MYFLAKIMMGGGTTFLNYVFSQKVLKNRPNLGVNILFKIQFGRSLLTQVHVVSLG